MFTVGVEGGSWVDHTGTVVRAYDTSRGRRTERATHHRVGVQSVRHITGSAYKRTHHGVGVRAYDTSRGRRTSVRHITGSAYERATHHRVGVQSGRHVTGSAYRACDTSRGRRTSVRHITGSTYEKRTSGLEQRRERDVSMENVVRDNYVKGL